MITKEQLKEKLLSMIEEANKGMIKNVDRILESGCIDWEEFENDYILPRICLNALLKEEEFQFKLHEPTRKEKKLMESLYACI